MLRLKKQRLALLLTQDDVAKRAELSRRVVIKAEGGGSVSIPTKRKLCRAVGWPISRWEELFEEVPA